MTTETTEPTPAIIEGQRRDRLVLFAMCLFVYITCNMRIDALQADLEKQKQTIWELRTR